MSIDSIPASGSDKIADKFFNKRLGNDENIIAIRNNILHQNLQKPFVDRFVKFAGYPVWNKAVTKVAGLKTNTSAREAANNSKVILVPLALDTQQRVNAILQVKIAGNDTAFHVLYKWQYNMNGYRNNTKFNSANQIALLFMGLESYTFGSYDFKINDSLLLKESRISDTIHIKSFNKNASDRVMLLTQVYFPICYEFPCPLNRNRAATYPILMCQQCDNYYLWIDDGMGNEGGSGGTGTGGGGGDSGGDDGGWQDDPCSPSGGSTGPQNRVWQLAPCDGGGSGDGGDDPWLPVLPEDDGRDANGYLYTRITELQTILQDFPQALEPCDSLNIMPLETYGPMWQNVAQFTTSQSVMDRIDSIKNVAPQWWLNVDNFNIQSLDEAYGAIVNCDFFPVRITQLPTGYTPESLLEYFRKHINNFIDPNLSTSFGPYIDGDFNDVQKYVAPFEESIGTLWSLKLGPEYVPDIDGSVIESGYSRYNSGGHETDYFTFSTMTTPLDFGHPVAGNRRFGIYSDPDHPGEYVFYTMGVDRTSDWLFDVGNSSIGGFSKADSLWTNLQNGMIQFIQNNNGTATFYSNHNTIARPQWEDVSKYLHGDFDFVELKRRLGC